VTGLNVIVHDSVAGPEGLQQQQQQQQQQHQTMNQPAHKGDPSKRENKRVNRLHRLSDHWLGDRISVLLATIECLRRGGAEGCGCCGGETDKKRASESEEKPEVRYSMAHG
jgi:hypothetical protein